MRKSQTKNKVAIEKLKGWSFLSWKIYRPVFIYRKKKKKNLQLNEGLAYLNKVVLVQRIRKIFIAADKPT